MIYVSVSEIGKIELKLGNMKQKARMVIARSLNRAASNARTNLVRQAREEYYIKASDVRSTVTIDSASASSSQMKVIIKSRGTKRELAAFKINPTAPRPKRPPAVLRVAVKRAGGFKPLPGAFLVRGSRGIHVTTRIGKPRYPIQTKYGLAVPQMIGSNLSRREYRSHLEKEAYGIFLKRLDHEIGRILGGK